MKPEAERGVKEDKGRVQNPQLQITPVKVMVECFIFLFCMMMMVMIMIDYHKGEKTKYMQYFQEQKSSDSMMLLYVILVV